MEQLSPFPPQSNDEGAKEQKHAILTSLKWGEGWPRCFIYFVQDCWLDFRRSLCSCPVYVTQLFIATRKKKYETRKVGRGKGPRKRKAKRQEKFRNGQCEKINWLMFVGKLKYFTVWYVILGKSIFLVKIAFSAKLRAN